jgi:hypothetical protein
MPPPDARPSSAPVRAGRAGAPRRKRPGRRVFGQDILEILDRQMHARPSAPEGIDHLVAGDRIKPGPHRRVAPPCLSLQMDRQQHLLQNVLMLILRQGLAAPADDRAQCWRHCGQKARKGCAIPVIGAR